jgi:hypothetical protein
MDDKNFDRATANEWIRIIEDPAANVRENDIYPIIKIRERKKNTGANS